MCTPKGSAILWASNELKDKITPLCVSWGSWINTAKDGFFIDENEYLGTRDYSPFLSIPFSLKWMKEHDWPLIQSRCRALKSYGIELLLKIEGMAPMLEKEITDPLT